jgi:hypothetical protein
MDDGVKAKAIKNDMFRIVEVEAYEFNNLGQEMEDSIMTAPLAA